MVGFSFVSETYGVGWGWGVTWVSRVWCILTENKIAYVIFLLCLDILAAGTKTFLWLNGLYQKGRGICPTWQMSCLAILYR